MNRQPWPLFCQILKKYNRFSSNFQPQIRFVVGGRGGGEWVNGRFKKSKCLRSLCFFLDFIVQIFAADFIKEQVSVQISKELRRKFS